jgi:PAS domain S-box-containing protein
MSLPIKILHLEDIQADAALVEHELKKSGLNYEFLWVSNKPQFERALRDFLPDVILSDHSLPSFNSIEAFKLVINAGITAPFILVTATISEDFAVSRLRDGVTDYLLKDRLERLPSAISNALEKCNAENERQRFFEKIVENERLLRKTEKLAHIASWKRDLGSDYIHWSDECFALFGYEINEIYPSLDMVMKHVHADDLKMFKKIISEAEHTEESSKMTFRIIDKKGVTKWLYCELAAEFDHNGQPAVLRGFNQDITARKEDEETLRKSEANLTAIVENTDAFIYSLDVNLRYLTFNSVLKNGLMKDYGITVNPGDEMLNFYGDDQESIRIWKGIYTEAFNGKQFQFTQELTAHGIKRFVHFSINPVWQDGSVISLSCYARDITKEKLAELEIISLNESLEKKVIERTTELKAANKELEAFSYTVAHDLRAPLRITSGFVGMLLKDHGDNLNEEGKYLLQVITQNAEQMSELVADLLELSRLGRVIISPVSCNMQELVEQSLEFVKASTGNFKASVKILHLPEVKCDPHLIKQVWLNLISNAVKYSGKKENPVIEIGSNPVENGIEYYVKDNGAGFDINLSSNLFHPFQRLHKKSEYEGTGVGLALAHVIVTKHGGEMWADAAVGLGATFFFSLPN